MIPETNPYNNWSGNGSTTTFDFDFYIEDASQLAVYHTNNIGEQVLLEYGVDYSINQIGNENGSYITFPIGGSTYGLLAEDEVISLCLTLPVSQENEYGKSSYLNLETLEYSLDYLTRLIQILYRQVARTVKINEGSSQSVDEFIQDLQAGNNLARKWAEFMDGTVDGSGYSSKYHATSAANYADNARQEADRAQQYAESAEFGMKWLSFSDDNWVADNDKYKLTLSGVPIVDAIYKGTWSSKELVANVDIKTTDSGSVITSYEAFDGFVLAAVNVLGTYEHEQTVASDEWIIDHNTGHYPSVTLVDSSNVVMDGTVQYVSLNRVKVTFTQPVTGFAYLR